MMTKERIFKQRCAQLFAVVRTPNGQELSFDDVIKRLPREAIARAIHEGTEAASKIKERCRTSSLDTGRDYKKPRFREETVKAMDETMQQTFFRVLAEEIKNQIIVEIWEYNGQEFGDAFLTGTETK